MTTLSGIGLRTAAAFSLAILTGTSAMAQDKELFIYNWSNYIPPDLLQEYEKANGVKITLDTFDSNETMMAKLEANPGAYDVIFPSGYMVPVLAANGLLAEIDAPSMPNFANVSEAFRSVPDDPERKYSVPYMYGSTGIAYDSNVIGGELLEESWKVFFDPRPEFQGKIGSLSDPAAIWTSAAFYLGIDRCTTGSEDAKKILEVLQKQKPFVKVYSTQGTIDRTIAGEVAMHFMYNGAAHRVAQDRPGVVYILPVEGADQWADVAAVPAQAPHPEAAKHFLNWLMDPEVAGKITNFTGFMNGIDGSDQYLDEALRNDPAIVVPADQMDRLRPTLECSPETRELQSKVWTQLMK